MIRIKASRQRSGGFRRCTAVARNPGLAQRLLPLIPNPNPKAPRERRPDPERWTAMSQRESNLLWLKDILEHMMHCQEQLEWTEDEETVQVLTETMLRDLESCRRLLSETSRRRRDWATPAAV